MIKIILADDHPIFMSGLQQIIEEDENIEIAGTALNGEKALEILSVGNRVTENNVKNFWLITDVILLIIVVLGFIKKRIQIPKIRKK